MNSREVEQEAIDAVIAATQAYLPPDGISAEECISRILTATDNPKIVAAIRSRLPLASSVEATGGVTQQGVCHTIRGLVPDPNSASGYRLADATGVTSPDYVIEAWKCDGCGHLTNDMVADIKSIKDAGGLSCCPERKMLPLFAAPPSPRSDDGSGLTPHSTAVSAIAQERDVGKKIGYQWVYRQKDGSLELGSADVNDADDPPYAAEFSELVGKAEIILLSPFTTSPSAIDEGER